MKTSLRKLRGFGHHKSEKRENVLYKSISQFEELAQATQDMQDMKDCYDSLFSAAAATANCAYEISESFREMGDCLLEKNALNDDEESGKALLMLGKAQFDLQKHLDNYRLHISQTITNPSESLLNELRVVEEMKKQCDEKRDVFDYVISRYKDKGGLRGGKGESFSSHQLEAAYDEYEEAATLFVFRMKSLKQGQSRSLLTQAARHHASQLCCFRKAVKSLEAIEPQVKLITEQQHIDYQFCELDDDNGDAGHSDNDDDSESLVDDESEVQDGGVVSFDYGQHVEKHEVSTSRASMELDNADISFPKVSTDDAVQENLGKTTGWNSSIFGKDHKSCSKSAPLFAERKTDPVERFRKMQPSVSRRLYTYVLPTPVETQSPISGNSNPQFSQGRRASISGNTPNLWHSSPLEHKRSEKNVGNEKLSGSVSQNNSPSVLKESNKNNKSILLPPPPLVYVFSSPLSGLHAASDNKKIRRHAFSGPLMGKSKPISSASASLVSTGQSKPLSGSFLRTQLPRPLSTPKLSSRASPAFFSSPKINELHELPRPPTHPIPKRPNLVGYSGPLISKKYDLSTANRLTTFNTASALPTPRSISRSFSIPSNGDREMIHDSKPLESPTSLNALEGNISPPLRPISLRNLQPASSG